MKKSWPWLVAPVVSVFLLLSCSPGGGGPPRTDTNAAPYFREATGWITENIDPSYWTRQGYPAPATAFRGFWVYVTDPDGPQDITSMTITDPSGCSWVLADAAHGIRDYDSTYDFWGGFDYYNATDPARVNLGMYTVLVRDSAGHVISTSFTVTSPDSPLVESTSIASEESTSTPKMLARATEISASWTGPTLVIHYKNNEPKANNGYIWFYDATGNYIGRSGYLLGSSGGFHTGVSFYEVQPGDTGTHTAGEIGGVHVVLIDGYQYSPSQTAWDHRSISAYTHIYQ